MKQKADRFYQRHLKRTLKKKIDAHEDLYPKPVDTKPKPKPYTPNKYAVGGLTTGNLTTITKVSDTQWSFNWDDYGEELYRKYGIGTGAKFTVFQGASYRTAYEQQNLFIERYNYYYPPKKQSAIVDQIET